MSWGGGATGCGSSQNFNTPLGIVFITQGWLTYAPCMGQVGTQLTTGPKGFASEEPVFNGAVKVMRADWRAISSSLRPSLTFCSSRHRHSKTMASMQQKRMKARMIGESTVSMAQTAHSTHPQRRVLLVVDVLTVLFPQPSIVVVVISYSGISVQVLRQARAAHTCFCRRLPHTLQNPLSRLARMRKRITRAMQTRLMMAVAKNSSQPLSFSTPSTIKRTMPPRYPIMRHIQKSLPSQQQVRILQKPCDYQEVLQKSSSYMRNALVRNKMQYHQQLSPKVYSKEFWTLVFCKSQQRFDSQRSAFPPFAFSLGECSFWMGLMKTL